MNTLRIVVVDPAPIYRHAIAQALAPFSAEIHGVDCAVAAVTLLRRLAVSAARAARAIIPGQASQTLLITELALPDRNGLELIQLTHGQVDAALVLTTHDRVPALWLTYQTLGTHGFLSKRTTTAGAPVRGGGGRAGDDRHPRGG